MYDHCSAMLRELGPQRLDVLEISAGSAWARFPEQLPVVDLRFHDLLWSNPIAPSSMMVRRQLQHRFPDALRRMEDRRFLLDLTRAGHKLALMGAALAAHHKPDFGAGGLSADLVAMEKAELENYRALWRERALGTPLLITLYAWSARFVPISTSASSSSWRKEAVQAQARFIRMPVSTS